MSVGSDRRGPTRWRCPDRPQHQPRRLPVHGDSASLGPPLPWDQRLRYDRTRPSSMIVTFQKSHVKICVFIVFPRILTCDFWNVTIMGDGLLFTKFPSMSKGQ